MRSEPSVLEASPGLTDGGSAKSGRTLTPSRRRAAKPQTPTDAFVGAEWVGHSSLVGLVAVSRPPTTTITSALSMVGLQASFTPGVRLGAPRTCPASCVLGAR
jgi:hypothetical protein